MYITIVKMSILRSPSKKSKKKLAEGKRVPLEAVFA